MIEELLQHTLIEDTIVERVKNLSQSDIALLLKEVKEKKPKLLTEDFINDAFGRKIKIIKEFHENQRYSVNNYVERLNNRYSFLQQILVKKMELKNIVSINKCSDGFLSIIGIVKDKKADNILELEDTTGAVDVIISEENYKRTNLDDVIAVSGKYSNKKISSDLVLFPDIPLNEANYSTNDVNISFFSDRVSDFLISESVVKDKNNSIINFNTPALLSIDNIIILVLISHDPLEVLRKRYVEIKNTDFLIDTIPDIIFSDQNTTTNYKGTSIFPKNTTINLRTRDGTV
jgi:DNA polymerase II small subunit/DNA polymerase delta subunit B